MVITLSAAGTVAGTGSGGPGASGALRTGNRLMLCQPSFSVMLTLQISASGRSVRSIRRRSLDLRILPAWQTHRRRPASPPTADCTDGDRLSTLGADSPRCGGGTPRPQLQRVPRRNDVNLPPVCAKPRPPPVRQKTWELVSRATRTQAGNSGSPGDLDDPKNATAKCNDGT